jgi:hypothetical protein
MAVFWVAAPCNLVDVYRRFRCAYCLRHHSDEYAVRQTTRSKIPEDNRLYTRRFENLKSHLIDDRLR